MADDSARLLGLNINLAEVIKLASVAAVIYAQWTVMGKEIEDLKTQGATRAALILQAQKDISNLEVEQARDDIRFENLREIVIELRRQAGIRTPVPNP